MRKLRKLFYKWGFTLTPMSKGELYVEYIKVKEELEDLKNKPKSKRNRKSKKA